MLQKLNAQFSYCLLSELWVYCLYDPYFRFQQ